ncbi:MAG: glycosyltransferase family 39 protein [Thermoanaerobaculia bacterium]
MLSVDEVPESWRTALLAAATVALHLVCISQYGYFRDELYYIACSEHLDWGYVDQPPLIALIIFGVRHLLGDSLVALRLLPALGHGGLVLLTTDICRRLGGSHFARFLAALTVAIAPIYLGIGHFISMNIFEPLFWMGCIDVALAIFNGASPRLWLLFGLIAGVGLQNKHSTLFFGFAFLVALILSPERRQLRTVWIWAGGLLAALVFLPNVIWEVRHHFATIELLSNIAHSGKNAPVTPLSFFTGQITLMNPITLPVWTAGVVWLVRSERYRPLDLCWIVLAIEFIALKGKIYYMSPSVPMVLAAGAIAIESAVRSRGIRYAYLALIVIAGAAIAPMAIPILPVKTFIAYQQRIGLAPPATEQHKMGPLPQSYADEFGWPEMTATVARVYRTLSPADQARCAIFAQNYGQAGAIDFFGRRYGLPKSICAHQNYFLWGPRNYTGDLMIVLDADREDLLRYFNDVQQAAVVYHPYAMPYENDRPVHICRGAKSSLPQFWPKIKKWI